MASRWSVAEEKIYSRELRELYVIQNKTIAQIGLILGMPASTIYDRLIRLKISINKENKEHYLNKRCDIVIPKNYSISLAEFFGIMLGDGKLSHFQVMVTLGNKEVTYALYVAELFREIFNAKPNIITDPKKRYRIVYLGSTMVSKWLSGEGLVYNKVASQVDIPRWIFDRQSFMESFARGFFDTDGSIYKLKYGLQLSFTNYSLPLLLSLQCLLRRLGYRVSEISGPRFYITKRGDIERFFKEVQPRNKRHLKRFKMFLTTPK